MARKLVNFRLPEELLEQLRQQAETEQVSVTDLLIRYCEHGLQHTVDTDVGTVETDVKTDVKTGELYTAISQAIAPLQEQIDLLKTELGKYSA